MAEDIFTYTHSEEKVEFSATNLEEGDLILLKDYNMVKNQWSSGRVHKTIPNKNGKARSLKSENRIVLSYYVMYVTFVS